MNSHIRYIELIGLSCETNDCIWRRKVIPSYRLQIRSTSSWNACGAGRGFGRVNSSVGPKSSFRETSIGWLQDPLKSESRLLYSVGTSRMTCSDNEAAKDCVRCETKMESGRRSSKAALMSYICLKLRLRASRRSFSITKRNLLRPRASAAYNGLTELYN